MVRIRPPCVAIVLRVWPFPTPGGAFTFGLVAAGLSTTNYIIACVYYLNDDGMTFMIVFSFVALPVTLGLGAAGIMAATQHRPLRGDRR